MSKENLNTSEREIDERMMKKIRMAKYGFSIGIIIAILTLVFIWYFTSSPPSH